MKAKQLKNKKQTIHLNIIKYNFCEGKKRRKKQSPIKGCLKLTDIEDITD